jgi:uroporphyrinogen-III synthase
MTRHILLTRPVEESERMEADIRTLGFTPVISPVLVIEPIRGDWPAPAGFQGVILTSARALHSVPPEWIASELPVFAVGVRTAQAAIARGFRAIHVAEGDGEALHRTLEEAHLQPGLTLLHPCARHVARTFDLEQTPVVPWPVYEAKAAESLSDECLAHLDAGDIDAALFYSARSGKAFADLLEKYRRTDAVKPIKALCFSASVVKSVRHLPWADVRQAKRPDHTAMLELLCG